MAGERGLETLFLLTYCYDDLGLNKPEPARRYFNAIVSRYPDSPWAKAAQESLAAYEGTVKTSQRDATLLAKYDGNHDGSLDKAERAAMEADPLYKQQEKVLKDDELEAQLRDLIKRYDRNADGKLDKDELANVKNVVEMYADAPPRMTAGRKNPVAPLMTKHFPEISALLKKYDTNKDGGLDATELKALAKEIQKNP